MRSGGGVGNITQVRHSQSGCPLPSPGGGGGEMRQVRPGLSPGEQLLPAASLQGALPGGDDGGAGH